MVIAEAALHASLVVTPLRIFGTAAWQLPSALALGIAEQFTVVAVVSVTVKMVVQVALLPAASVAVTVMVSAPKPASVPAAGDCVMVIAEAALHASLTVIPLKIFGTAAWQLPSALALRLAERRVVGAGVSVTVQIVVQDELLPAASLAVTVMVCAPKPTSVPASRD